MIRVLAYTVLLAFHLASNARSDAKPHTEWSLVDGSQVHPDYRGVVPRKSDVVFSTRWKRPEAPEVAKSFGATRTEWVYSTDKEFVSSMKGVAAWFGGALNSNATSVPQVKPPSDDAIAKDFDGENVIFGWMKNWGGKGPHPGRVLTTTHPEAQSTMREQARIYLELGVDSVQIDGPTFQIYAADYFGGDFNPSTLSGFNEYLKVYPDKGELKRVGLHEFSGDYREFVRSKYGIKDAAEYKRRFKSLPTNAIWNRYVRETVRRHYVDFREFLKKSRGAAVPMSLNLGQLSAPDATNPYFYLASLADYSLAETPISSNIDLVSRAATIRALGLGYVPSILPLGLAENRVAIATLYALGAQPVVPWDTYTGNDSKGKPAPRLFGRVEDYGDLYRFVRAKPELFDGKELAAIVGIPVPVQKYESKATEALVRRLVDRNVPFAFVLTGGTDEKFRVEPRRVRHFKILLRVNPEGDFAPDDLEALRALPVPMIDAGQITDDAIRNLSPFLAAGSTIGLRLIPRATTTKGNATHLVIHLVDETRGSQREVDESCRRRIGLKRSLAGDKAIRAASWHAGGAVTRLKWSSTDREVLFSINGCSLWGAISIDY